MSLGSPILISRCNGLNPHHYDVVLDWIEQQHPDLLRHVAGRALPYSLPSDSKCRLHIPWLQDPVEDLHASAYRWSTELSRQCDERGIRTINRVDKHANVSRLEASRRLASAGIRTPKVVAVASEEELREGLCGMEPPVILRDNRSHQSPFVRIDSMSEAKTVSLKGFRDPVLAEFIDVASPDGAYRKFRCILLGDAVYSHHLQVTESWISRGKGRIKNASTREEEIEYLLAPEPHEELMRAARKALDLEFLGVDYALDKQGRVVVWEANLYPHIHFSKNDLVYRNFAMERTIAGMVRYYLEQAGIPAPARLIHQASYDDGK